MEQVLINLIKNAIEASPPEICAVVGELATVQTLVQVCIDDNGSGIPEHIWHQVMLPTISTSHKARAGVGLAIWS